MKIALDISPLSSGHSVRGIGFYTQTLINGLQKRHDEHEYILVKNQDALKSLSPDIIHYPFYDLFFKTAPTRSDIPLVVTLHDVTPLVLPELFPTGLRGWWNLRSQLTKLAKIDKIITDSVCSKKDINKFCNIPEEKIVPIYLACDESFQQETNIDKLDDVKKKYQLPDKYIIKVGDINKHKNFSRLFEALSKINEDIHLILVGKALDKEAAQIPELTEIVSEVKEFKLENRVHRLGFVPKEEMNALYTLARATVQNSLYEGFGLTALESMNCGTPVIAGNTGSQPEVVGKGGVLINPYSIEETKSAIEHMFALSQVEYNQLKDKALSQSKNFSVDKMVTETLSVYEQCKK